MNLKIIRKELLITGLIQGVGFRPFIFTLAEDLGLKGWVKNTDDGVMVNVEGGRSVIDDFLEQLQENSPINSNIETLTITEHKPQGYKVFKLQPSESKGKKSLFVLPDIASCPKCIAEIFDSTSRRYQYAFTSCSHCGPRYSIIKALPYDRVRTAMQGFSLCSACLSEYNNPADRRFHAQAMACPDCGPSVELLDNAGQALCQDISAIKQAADALSKGAIVALKGIGGFQLLVDASSQSSVARLRDKKSRPEKPFALMCRDMQQVDHIATVSAVEQQLLLSSAAPIVLVNKKKNSLDIADAVAPDNTRIGIMLACSPLHHLLLSYCTMPLVATSGNISNEPLCIDNQQALGKLGAIADLFLLHDRPILRPIDDSIMQEVYGTGMMLRAARGYAPMTIKLPVTKATEIPALALGGHLKNTFALSQGDYAIISQHNGDLESFAAVSGFKQNIEDLSALVQHQAIAVIRDNHTDYFSSQYADAQRDVAIASVQHHHAHLLSCMAEHQLTEPVLGIVWDGAGLGDDDTLWGGEFFSVEKNDIQRIASLRGFTLPGGAVAIKEPRRAALGLLWELMGESLFAQTDLAPINAFNEYELSLLQQALSKQINAPHCSSIGRLFDCIASLLGLCQMSSFEGQAAQRLEQSIGATATSEHYPLAWVQADSLSRFDWGAMLHSIIDDLSQAVSKPLIACKFHNTLVEMVLHITRIAGLNKVVLSGGSFQNRYLTEAIITRLSALDIEVYWQQKVPSNDGGLALGQLLSVINKGI